MVSNLYPQAITLDSFTLSGSIANVTADAIPAACKPIAANGTCNVSVTATDDANGSGTMTVGYNAPSGTAKTATAPITVANTTLAITPLTNGSMHVDYLSNIPTTFTVTNNGHFTWQSPSLILGTLPGISISSNTCTATPPTPGNHVLSTWCRTA